MNHYKQINYFIIFSLLFTAWLSYPQNRARPSVSEPINKKVYQPDSIVSKKEYSQLLKYDTSFVEIRTLDSTVIQSYLKDKDFSYFEDPEFTMNLWERFMFWLERQFLKISQSKPFEVFWDLIVYILIGFAVIAIIWTFFRSEVKGLFANDKIKNDLNVQEKVEDIYSLDLDKMIGEAIAKGNFRYAIRLNYLNTLKKLSDKNLINWKLEKTNREFIREIKLEVYRTGFERITNEFEFIWYGGFNIDEIKYKELQLVFNDLNSSIGTAD